MCERLREEKIDLEGTSIDLHYTSLDEGLGSHQLVVRSVVLYIQNSGLGREGFTQNIKYYSLNYIK